MADRVESWWGFAGPASIVDRVVREVSRSERTVVVEAPGVRPDGLVDAIVRRFERDLALGCLHFDARSLTSGSIAHALGDCADAGAAEIADIDSFLNHPSLADKAIIVDGIEKRAITRWGLFLRSLTTAPKSDVVIGPIIILIAPTGLTAEERAVLCGRARRITTQGVVSRNDTIGYLASIGARPALDIMSRVAFSVSVEVSAWSRTMLEQMVSWEDEEQAAPIDKLEALAAAEPLAYPCWENGLVDLWDEEPAAHPVAAIAHGMKTHVERRIWAGQAAVLLPLADRIRRGFINRYRDVLDRHVSPEKPLERMINDRPFVRYSPDELEFYELKNLLRPVMSREEMGYLRSTKEARDLACHAMVVPLPDLRRLSMLHDDHQHLFEPDLAGWDWPRTGQTMTLTIGPSLGGKSTWAANQGIEVISDEAIAASVSPESLDPEMDMLRAVRNQTAKALAAGKSVIVDAAHVELRSRMRQLSCAPGDLAIRYAIINRPLIVKQGEAGDRLSAVNAHHASFTLSSEAIMAGDGLDRVEVVDCRPEAPAAP